MFLFVGLGNPGERYSRTRHNLGFRVVDSLARMQEVGWRKGPGPYYAAETAIEFQPVILAKPTTFMNRSGIAVCDLVIRYAIQLSQAIVVCDDLNLPPGSIRIRKGGSDGGHNGLASVIRYMGSDQVPRLRMGIGSPNAGAIDYVLSHFSKKEESVVEETVDRAALALIEIAKVGLEKAMNRFN